MRRCSFSYTKRGFLLIEWLIYLFLTLFLVTCIFQLSSVIHMGLQSEVKCSFEYTQMCAGFDMLIRDLMAAPNKKEYWKIINTDELAWYSEVQGVDIHWFVDSNRLFRAKTIRKDGLTPKSKKNLVASGIKSLKFTHISTQDFVISLGCFLEGVAEKMTFYFERSVVLRNRVLL